MAPGGNPAIQLPVNPLQALGGRTIRRPKRRGHVVLPEQTDQSPGHTTPPTIAGASPDDVQALSGDTTNCPPVDMRN
jgi:hypothetical protein